MKPLAFIGVILGLILPWYAPIGLLGASITALLLFILCFYAVLVTKSRYSLLHRSWIRREVIREWLLYISIGTGIIGITSTLLSIVAPIFFNQVIGVEIPLAFDTISVSAAFLEAMIPLTSYRKILSLMHLYFLEKAQDTSEQNNALLEIDFPNVISETSFTEFELRDVLESLVKDGSARKIISKQDLEYRLTSNCLEFLRISLEETRIKIKMNADLHEAKLNEFLENLDKMEIKDNFKILKKIEDIEKDLVLFIEDNKRFDAIYFLKVRLNTLIDLKKTLYSEEMY